MAKLTQQQFYCVQCRKRVTAKKDDIFLEFDRNGRPRLVGSDSKGHLLYKYVKVSDADKLARKYN